MAMLYPLIFYGPTDLPGNWAPGGGGIVVAGTDPFGGNTGAKISGSSGASIAARPTVWGRDGYQEIQLFVSGGVANTTSSVFLFNSSGVTTFTMYLYWNVTGCYSSSEAGATSANGQNYQPVQLGTSGWSIARMSYASMSIATNPAIRITPNINGVGSINIYNRSAVFSAYGLCQPVSYDKARDGSDWVQAASGDEDSWIVATDNYMTGQIRWINNNAVDLPMQPQSGWFGDNCDVGINCGWKSLVNIGTTKSVMRWVMNRYNFPGKYYDCYLFSPIDGSPPTVETDWTFALPLTVRNPSGSSFELY